MKTYEPSDWYWIVAGDETQVYASARASTVAAADPIYGQWSEAGGVATRIASQDDLIAVLRAANVAPYHRVRRSVIVARLQAADKLAAARTALDAADLYVRELWNSGDAINADDPAALSLLNAIGADAQSILAPAG